MKIKKKTIQSLLLSCILTSAFVTAQMSPNVIKKFSAQIIYKIDEVTSKVALSEEKQMRIGVKILQQDSLANAGLATGESINKLKKYFAQDNDFLKKLLTPEESDTYFYELDQDNRFLVALKLAKELKLEHSQINEIRRQNDILTALSIKENFRKYKIYNDKLDSILTKRQYGCVISSMYKKDAAASSIKDWNNILKYNLATIKDSSTVYTDLYRYKLLIFSILDFKSERSQDKNFQKLKDKITLDFQPEILTHYNIISDQFYQQNIFSEAIKFEKELNLTPVQTDSLLAHYKQLELLRMKVKKENLVEFTYREYAKIEDDAISKILETKQLTDFLFLKNYNKARGLSLSSWKLLEKHNLTKDLDKANTLKEFVDYQLKALVASDRQRMNNNQVNTFLKRDIENKKPELLQQLEAFKQTEANTKSTKNELRW